MFNTAQARGIDNEDIFAPEAWTFRSTSPDIVVAIIDSGYRQSLGLNDNIRINKDEIWNNVVDDENNGFTDDSYGSNFSDNHPLPVVDSHGTHVAGIAGAEGNNNFGVTWDVQLMPIDLFGTQRYSQNYYEVWSKFLDAVDYAVGNGADVINASLGWDLKLTPEEFSVAVEDLHTDTFRTFKRSFENGTTNVIVAGNESLDFDQDWISYPALYSEFKDGVISVAANADTGDIADYSNYGSSVTIAAPRDDLTDDLRTGVMSIVPNSQYNFVPGTSMASPIVAGATVLIMAENSNLTPADVEDILQISP